MIRAEDVGAIEAVSGKIGYRFSDSSLLLTALTHRSFANEQGSGDGDNQRLEFLGDAVLGLVAADLLIARLKDAVEGQLAPRRAALVREESLAEMARAIDLGSALRLGRGEESSHGRDRPSILADAFEAVVGAVYLDGGYQACKQVIVGLLGSRIDAVVQSERLSDAKTALQELLQSGSLGPPRYRVVGEEGPDHAKVFEVAVEAGERLLAVGRGRSKKEAEQEAAMRALAALEGP